MNITKFSTKEIRMANAIHSVLHDNGFAETDECYNISMTIVAIIKELMTELSSNLTENSSKVSEARGSPLVYIVVVLSFYAFGIGLMMIKYMRQEAKEHEETKTYRRYLSNETYLNATNRSRLTNRLALQTLNTVNAISQTQMTNKVTFV